MKKHTEARLEDAIVDHLTTQGGYVFVDYRSGPAKDRYDNLVIRAVAVPAAPVCMPRQSARARRSPMRTASLSICSMFG